MISRFAYWLFTCTTVLGLGKASMGQTAHRVPTATVTPPSSSAPVPPTMQEVAAFLETAMRPSCRVKFTCSEFRISVEAPGLLRYYARDTAGGEKSYLFDLTRMDPASVKAVDARNATMIVVSSRSGERAVQYGSGANIRTIQGDALTVAPDAAGRCVIAGFVYAIELAQGMVTPEALSDIRATMERVAAISAGPTMAETVLWLKAHVPVYDEGQNIDANGILTQNAWRENDGKVVEWAKISPHNLNGLVADRCTLRRAQVACVRLSGSPAEACSADEERSCREIEQAHVFLGENTSQEEVDKVIKALKRLAELNGAVLPKDDLF